MNIRASFILKEDKDNIDAEIHFIDDNIITIFEVNDFIYIEFTEEQLLKTRDKINLLLKKIKELK